MDRLKNLLEFSTSSKIRNQLKSLTADVERWESKSLSSRQQLRDNFRNIEARIRKTKFSKKETERFHKLLIDFKLRFGPLGFADVMKASASTSDANLGTKVEDGEYNMGTSSKRTDETMRSNGRNSKHLPTDEKSVRHQPYDRPAITVPRVTNPTQRNEEIKMSTTSSGNWAESSVKYQKCPFHVKTHSDSSNTNISYENKTKIPQKTEDVNFSTRPPVDSCDKHPNHGLNQKNEGYLKPDLKESTLASRQRGTSSSETVSNERQAGGRGRGRSDKRTDHHYTASSVPKYSVQGRCPPPLISKPLFGRAERVPNNKSDPDQNEKRNRSYGPLKADHGGSSLTSDQRSVYSLSDERPADVYILYEKGRYDTKIDYQHAASSQGYRDLKPKSSIGKVERVPNNKSLEPDQNEKRYQSYESLKSDHGGSSVMSHQRRVHPLNDEHQVDAHNRRYDTKMEHQYSASSVPRDPLQERYQTPVESNSSTGNLDSKSVDRDQNQQRNQNYEPDYGGSPLTSHQRKVHPSNDERQVDAHSRRYDRKMENQYSASSASKDPVQERYQAPLESNSSIETLDSKWVDRDQNQKRNQNYEPHYTGCPPTSHQKSAGSVSDERQADGHSLNQHEHGDADFSFVKDLDPKDEFENERIPNDQQYYQQLFVSNSKVFVSEENKNSFTKGYSSETDDGRCYNLNRKNIGPQSTETNRLNSIETNTRRRQEQYETRDVGPEGPEGKHSYREYNNSAVVLDRYRKSDEYIININLDDTEESNTQCGKYDVCSHDKENRIPDYGSSPYSYASEDETFDELNNEISRKHIAEQRRHEHREHFSPKPEDKPVEIIDVGQYFRNDLDLKSLDSLSYVDQIERIDTYARSFEDTIDTFAEEKFSLEYFVIDEKLMRLIEKLDKIKCQDEEELIARKVQAIQYIKKLHDTLDQNAKED